MEQSFWLLGKTWTSPAKRVEWEDEIVELESVKCPVDPTHQHPGKRLTDLSVVLPDGAVQDFAWTWHNECLLQDRTLELLRSSRFTGFDVKPVTARFKTWAKDPPKLWELVLTGWAGMAKPESGIRFDEPGSCAVCKYFHYSGLLDPRQLIDTLKWDGSDFFMVWPLPKYVFVTERVVQLIQENRLSGAILTPVSELKQTDGYTPGRLSHSMPNERASELGEPLGIY